MADGTITFDTKINSDDLKQQIKNIKDQIKSETKEANNLASEEKNYRSLSNKNENLAFKAREKGDIKGVNSYSYIASQYFEKAEDVQTKWQEKAKAIDILKNSLKDYEQQLEQVNQQEKQAKQQTEEETENKKDMQKAMASALKGVTRFGSMIKMRLKRMLINAIFNSVSKGYQALIKQDTDFRKQNQQLGASFNALGGSIVSAFKPLLDVCMPIIQNVIDKVTEAVNAFGKFLATISGASSYKKAVKQINATSKALNKTVASFDEINKMDGGSSSSSNSVKYQEEAIGKVGNLGAYVIEMLSKMTENITKALGKATGVIFGWIIDTYNNIKNAIEGYFKPYIEMCGGDIVDGLLIGILNGIYNIGVWIYKHIFAPFIEGFKEAFGIHSPSKVMQEMGGYIIQGLLNGVSNFSGVVELFKKLWAKIKEVFKPVSDWFTEIFGGAWNAVKKVINGMLSGIESSINSIIKALNKIAFDVPSWVPVIGGKSFGFNLKNVSIPRLATGDVVPPNAGEFMAILGDNKKETEVVSPLSTMKQAMLEALAENGSNAEMISLLRIIAEKSFTATISTSEITDAQERRNRRAGKDLSYI